DWIAGMPVPKADVSSGVAAVPAEDRAALETLRRGDRGSGEARSTAIRRLAATTRGAPLLLCLIDREPRPAPPRPGGRAVTRRRRGVGVRTVVGRFAPGGGGGRRGGAVAARRSILPPRGDARRGRDVFTPHPAAQCKTCHKAGEVGEAVGPDLTKIGAKYDRVGLLDQILEPSKTIDPQYVAHLLETKDGQVITGLVVEKSARQVVLKDAQDKKLRGPAPE